MRTTSMLVLVLGMVLGGVVPAAAQWRHLEVEGLTSSDIALRTEAGRQLDDQEIGAETQWENPETRNRGRVKLLGRDEQDGMPCRTLAHQIHVSKTQEDVDMTFRSCLKDGRWLLAPKE